MAHKRWERRYVAKCATIKNTRCKRRWRSSKSHNHIRLYVDIFVCMQNWLYCLGLKVHTNITAIAIIVAIQNRNERKNTVLESIVQRRWWHLRFLCSQFKQNIPLVHCPSIHCPPYYTTTQNPCFGFHDPHEYAVKHFTKLA